VLCCAVLCCAVLFCAVLQVEDALYSLVDPTPSGSEPYLVAYSKEVAAMLDLDAQECERWGGQVVNQTITRISSRCFAVALYSSSILLGGFVLQVDTFTAERYSPHQITRHNSKVQAPAPWGTSSLVKGLSYTASKTFVCL
jgi:hypothetical protein